MPGKTIQIRSSTGSAFDCYLATPVTGGKVPAIVLACAIVGVDQDLRDIADELAARGYIAAAPDLFWRSVPGPLPHEDSRTRPRGQPRLEKIKAGEFATRLPPFRLQELDRIGEVANALAAKIETTLAEREGWS